MGFDIGAAIGGIGSSALSAREARKAQERQIAWERERATHAHQWEVQDLKAAGLNPILSANAGAETSGIGAIMGDMSGIANISQSSSSAKQAKTAEKAQKSLENLQNSQEKLNEAQETAALADAKLKENEAQNSALNAQYTAAKNASEIPALERQGKYNTSAIGGALQYVGMGLRDLSPALNLFGIGMGARVGAKALKNITSALKGAKGTQAMQQIQRVAPPKGNLRPATDKDLFRFKHVPAIYRRGYKSH